MFEFTSLEPASAPRFATQKIKFSRFDVSSELLPSCSIWIGTKKLQHGINFFPLTDYLFRTLLLQLSLAVELHLPPSRLFELQSGAFVLLSQNPAQVLRCENTEPAKLRREDA
ncbi:uncharacterized protein [Malus domestica]|uniref:uncharacterized protein isoform X1 n=1 Tax=Malus domestica TaxID=3750 RepID=UPI0039767EE7